MLYCSQIFMFYLSLHSWVPSPPPNTNPEGRAESGLGSRVLLLAAFVAFEVSVICVKLLAFSRQEKEP